MCGVERGRGRGLSVNQIQIAIGLGSLPIDNADNI